MARTVHATQTIEKVQKLYQLLHETQAALGRYAPDADEGAGEFNAAWIEAEEGLRDVIRPAEREAARQARDA